MENQKQKPTGLWVNTKKGTEATEQFVFPDNMYISGTLPDGRKVMIYKNKFKQEGDRKPNLNMYVEPVEQLPQSTGTDDACPF